MMIKLEGVELEGQELGMSFDYIDVTLLVTATLRPGAEGGDGETGGDTDDEGGGRGENLNQIATAYINDSRMVILSRLKTSAMTDGSDFFVELDRIGVGLGRTKEPTLTPSETPTEKVSC